MREYANTLRTSIMERLSTESKQALQKPSPAFMEHLQAELEASHGNMDWKNYKGLHQSIILREELKKKINFEEKTCWRCRYSCKENIATESEY
mmetsp:Transcript_12979/g.18545  ORF Transcript_12979/g.18545 Transcript_12979/m.18545 type:complete len:93 (-) Transcript_12979:592-870(-)